MTLLRIWILKALSRRTGLHSLPPLRHSFYFRHVFNFRDVLTETEAASGITTRITEGERLPLCAFHCCWSVPASRETPLNKSGATVVLAVPLWSQLRTKHQLRAVPLWFLRKANCDAFSCWEPFSCSLKTESQPLLHAHVKNGEGASFKPPLHHS